MGIYFLLKPNPIVLIILILLYLVAFAINILFLIDVNEELNYYERSNHK